MELAEQNDLSRQELELRFKIIRFKARGIEIEKIWRQFTAAGFRLLVIKGWAAAEQFYPQPFQREFVDLDIMVEPGEFERAVGFSKDLRSSLPIDLHKGPRHLDVLEFEELYSCGVTLNCNSTEIKVPRPEDHLRILCNHWLTDGGANRDKLRDIYYAVSGRSNEFEWDRFLNSGNFRRRRWLECAVGLCAKYSDLDISDTPIPCADRRIPGWVIKSVEDEWKSDIKLQPLNFYSKDKKLLWEQLKKRMPPNAVQATILEEGDFDHYPRIWYQFKNIFSRLAASLKKSGGF